MSLRTTCPLDCPDRCSILCRSESDSSTLRIEGDPEHPHTRGFTCSKIRRYPERLKSPHRIREPWIRRGDHFVSASWDEALTRVCAALDDARRAGPGSILLVRGNGSMGLSKAYTDHVLGHLGARGTAGSLCDAAGCAAVEEDAGALRMNDPLQIDTAEAIVLWGKNPKASSIHTAAQVADARKRGVPVLAVNPDASAVRDLVDRVIPVRPGADRFLALAVTKILAERAPAAPPWKMASNAAEFTALVEGASLSDLLAASGATTEHAETLASLYGGTRRVATLVGWGIQRYPFGAENVRAVHALAFAAGTLGIQGGGLYFNVPSGRHLRRPRPPACGAPPLVLPALAREIPRAEPRIRVVWVTCSNFLNQGPDAKAARESLASVPTVVAVEGFWTETARQATVVLPPALWLEEEDVAASYWHRGLGAVRKIVEPAEDCRTDFEIAQEVARRLGVATPFDSVDSWLSSCLPDPGPTLDELRSRGWWLCEEPAVAWESGFAHPDGRFRLLGALSPQPPPDPHHPYDFLTLVRADALNSQLLPEQQGGALPVRLNPATADALGLSPADAVRVVSATGEIEGEAHLDPGLHPDAVACPRGGWLSLGQGVNEATEIRLTDLGQGAAFYGTAVRVEKARHG